MLIDGVCVVLLGRVVVAVGCGSFAGWTCRGILAGGHGGFACPDAQFVSDVVVALSGLTEFVFVFHGCIACVVCRHFVC